MINDINITKIFINYFKSYIYNAFFLVKSVNDVNLFFKYILEPIRQYIYVKRFIIDNVTITIVFINS